jgi:hypothetical protein
MWKPCGRMAGFACPFRASSVDDSEANGFASFMDLASRFIV